MLYEEQLGLALITSSTVLYCLALVWAHVYEEENRCSQGSVLFWQDCECECHPSHRPPIIKQCDPINPFLAALASAWWISMAGPSRTGRPMRRRRRLKGQVANTADRCTCTMRDLNTRRLGLDHGHQRRETKQVHNALNKSLPVKYLDL